MDTPETDEVRRERLHTRWLGGRVVTERTQTGSNGGKPSQTVVSASGAGVSSAPALRRVAHVTKDATRSSRVSRAGSSPTGHPTGFDMSLRRPASPARYCVRRGARMDLGTYTRVSGAVGAGWRPPTGMKVALRSPALPTASSRLERRGRGSQLTCDRLAGQRLTVAAGRLDCSHSLPRRILPADHIASRTSQPHR